MPAKKRWWSSSPSHTRLIPTSCAFLIGETQEDADAAAASAIRFAFVSHGYGKYIRGCQPLSALYE